MEQSWHPPPRRHRDASDRRTAESGGQPPPAPASATSPGTAGASARREYERRKSQDEQRQRDKWGAFGGLAVAMSPERQRTKAWVQGAVGEERLGARLDSLISDDLAVLHDRRIPGTSANIDHLVVTRQGVWAVDAKRYKGRPERRIEGGILRPRVERLFVGRRDCTKLVDGVLKQVNRVHEAVPGVAVTGAICFVDADWPLVGRSFVTQNVHVLWPKKLLKSLANKSVGNVDVSTLCRLLAKQFPSA
jgi:hypothetical protein